MTTYTKSKDLVIRGARENNLKNIDVAIPREQLVVITGLSGSGKSSLAFETIYAEGQRRFLESLSAYARRRVEQLKKPDVDYVYGLSPVVSIEQKTVSRNPRSTVGTMTDIYDFVRLLYASAGRAHCPVCRAEVPLRSPHQIAEHLLALPEGTTVEICAPVHKIYGEDFNYLFGEIRTRGYRRLYVDDELRDISQDLELDERRAYRLEVLVDRFTVKREARPAQRRDLRDDILKQVVVSAQGGLRVGEGFLRFRLTPPAGESIDRERFSQDFCCPQHLTVMGELHPYYFSFNEPDSACPTCGGLGTYMKVHPELLVPHPERSIRAGCFVPEAFSYDKNTWQTKIMVSVAAHAGFSLDVPWSELPEAAREVVLYGTKGERFPIVMPPGATRGVEHTGRLFRFDGIINDIERRYKHYRRQQVAHVHMETYLRRVMAEHTCPDCRGTKLKPQRLLVTLKGLNIHELGELPIAALRAFLEDVPFTARNRQAGEQVRQEIVGRLDLLLGIGVDYLSLNRRSMTLSGGESQRIRLSTQIGSGLMGMLYVLDEPSIGLHPKDNVKMIHTLQRLRDIGNTVIVVEHDEETIRAADHIVELGPGPGVHGGQVVAQGTIADIERHPESLTGAYLRGARRIALPPRRRPLPLSPWLSSPQPPAPATAGKGGEPDVVASLPTSAHRSGVGGEGLPHMEERSVKGKRSRGWLVIRGARENNLRGIDVPIPLGVLVCVTGASGSGKSSLVSEILYKRLHHLLHDSRTLYGAHDCIEGVEQVSDVIDIDQSPIGRSPRSNPATYIGFYDDIRRLFADTEEARARGYSAGRFSFNIKGGRCEECAGEGIVITSLHFMPDVENPCPACKGARYNEETLEVAYRGRNIAEVLDMTVEEGVEFFKDQRLIAHKLRVLNDLGLGYLRLGQSSTTLSGGEAQRVKLAAELGKIKRGGHNLYILDEPTTGLHLADIQRLLDSLNRLVDAGHTVLVIEHHLDVIKTADYVIDLGPEGGHAGGELVAAGTPEEVARCERSHTGRYLRPHLGMGERCMPGAPGT
ncbi:MAG TPA: excinuclease ABC subunit UvrA [Roseiflexaceae bacterium]|nr:excinuclease ABC subunit UvrA [Roseiflexaceae bacterium]